MERFTRPILIDVDTQVDFMCASGALYVPGAEAIAPQLARLAQAARAAGLPHLATLDTHTPDDPEFAAFGFPAHCVAETAGWAKIGETALTGRDGELAFRKDTFDVFTNPAFPAAVAGLAPSVALVMGVATDYCVKAAVLGLRAMGVPVVLVEDAIAAVTPETGAAALAQMAAAGATRMTTAEVVAALAAPVQVVAHVA